MHHRRKRILISLASLALLLALGFGNGTAIELWSSTRDAFPVFDDPPGLSAQAAEAQGVVAPRDMVIGLALGGAARAYPLRVMGVHELGNDNLGGMPVAITW